MRRLRRGSIAVAALATILLITVAWWALALWPVPASAPAWVMRTRVLCFGAASAGGPDLGGWMLLIGEPLGLLGVLVTVWGSELRDGLRPVVERWGRSLALTLLPLPVLAVAMLLGRARETAGEPFAVAEPPEAVPDLPRLDRPAPPLALLDQRGDTVRLERFRGRPVLLTFGYAHCAHVCPLTVHEVSVARARLRGAAPAVLVITVDPWRDTPARLPSIAAAWGLAADAHVLGGSVAGVEATLDAWSVPRARDVASGEITHAPVVMLVDRRGRLAYMVPGGTDAIVEYARRL